MQRRSQGVVAATVAGLAMCFSLPPWGLWPLAVASVALLDRVIADRPAASRFRRTALFGVSWLLPSTLWMWDFTKPGWFAAVALMSAMIGAAGALTPPTAPRRWLALPAALTLAEFVRWSVPLGGVPLSSIPLSQAASPLAPLARIGGGPLLVLTVAALGVAVSAAAAGISGDRRRVAGLAAVLALLPGAAGALAATTVPRATPAGTLRVAVVQGGGPQRTRAVTSDADAVFDRHVAATAAISDDVDLVVWPENVISVNAPLARTEEGRRLSQLSEQLDAPLVVGVVETVNEEAFTNYSVVVVGGRFGSRYDKVLRVPFGEYVPLRALTDTLSGGAASRFIPRDALAGTQPAVLDSPAGRLGVVISWEVFFERRARDAIGNGGTLLLNPTNGSSYWLTIVQSQQVASSRLRAVETDRWVLQAAPTGFSAVIGPNGQVLQRSGISDRAVLIDAVQHRQGLSPATRFGPWPWLGLVAVALLAARLQGRRRPPPGAFAPVEPPAAERLGPSAEPPAEEARAARPG